MRHGDGRAAEEGSDVALLIPNSAVHILTLLRAIILALTGNSWLPAPTPTVAALTAAGDSLEKSISAAKTKASGTAAAQKAQAKAAHQLLRQLQRTVLCVCESNPTNAAAITNSVSMHIVARAGRGVAIFGAKQDTKSGTVNLTAPTAGHGSSHEWQYWTTDITKPVSVPRTSRGKTSIPNLTPGVLYSFRHQSWTAKGGDSGWGQTITMVVV